MGALPQHKLTFAVVCAYNVIFQGSQSCYNNRLMYCFLLSKKENELGAIFTCELATGMFFEPLTLESQPC